MKLIKHSTISGSIFTLLDESDEKVILVSPYMNISKWYKLINKLKKLKSRNIDLEIYVRDDPDNSVTYRDLDRLGLSYLKIHNLHTKLYLNEKQGILTSMNLLLSSETNSLEIACITENQMDYKDLQNYYERYIRNEGTFTTEQALADQQKFRYSICDELKQRNINSWPSFGNSSLHINTSSTYYKVKVFKGHLIISAFQRKLPKPNIVQETKQLAKRIERKIKPPGEIMINVQHEPESKGIIISGQALKIMKSKTITAVLEDEVPLLIQHMAGFIEATELWTE